MPGKNCVVTVGENAYSWEIDCISTDEVSNISEVNVTVSYMLEATFGTLKVLCKLGSR